MDDVLSRLGLNNDPFDDVVIDDLFFTGAGRGALVDELVHQVRYGEDLCLVSGDPGIGKTRLWHHLQKLAPADTVYAAMQAQLFLTEEQFVAQCMASDDDTLADEYFEQHLRDLAQHKRQHWLLIDDAQELHDSLYKKIAQWMAQFKGTLRVVLFADGTLKYRLQNPALGFSLSSWDLQHFGPSEVAEYLMYRLRYAGWDSDELPFSAEELDQICRHSEGVPLHIHDLAIAVLQKNDEMAAPAWRKLLGWPYLHVGLLLLAASTLMVVWIGGGSGGSETAVQTDVPVASDVSRPLADKTPTSSTTVATQGGSAVIEFHNSSQPAEPASASNSAAAPAANTPPPMSDAAVVADGSGVKVHPQTDSEPVAAKSVAAPVVAPPVVAAEKPRVAPVPVAPAKPIAPTPTPTVVKEKPVAAPKLQQKTSVTAAPAKPKAPQGSSPLARMSPQHYVVQLLAATDPARLESFRKSLPAGLSLASYQRITNGQRWHVLVYGDFSSIAQARASINKLPAVARDQKPWAKPVAQVHKEMATVRQ